MNWGDPLMDADGHNLRLGVVSINLFLKGNGSWHANIWVCGTLRCLDYPCEKTIEEVRRATMEVAYQHINEAEEKARIARSRLQDLIAIEAEKIAGKEGGG